MVLKDMPETPVLLTTSASVLMMIHGHPNVAKRRTELTASGIFEVFPRRPLYILVANFDEKPTHLPKNMEVAVGESPPQCIVHLPGDERPTPQPGADGVKSDDVAETINSVHYKTKEDRSTQMSWHQEVHAKEVSKRQSD